jgi:hypothetical protein
MHGSEAWCGNIRERADSRLFSSPHSTYLKLPRRRSRSARRTPRRTRVSVNSSCTHISRGPNSQSSESPCPCPSCEPKGRHYTGPPCPQHPVTGHIRGQTQAQAPQVRRHTWLSLDASPSATPDAFTCRHRTHAHQGWQSGYCWVDRRRGAGGPATSALVVHKHRHIRRQWQQGTRKNNTHSH